MKVTANRLQSALPDVIVRKESFLLPVVLMTQFPPLDRLTTAGTVQQVRKSASGLKRVVIPAGIPLRFLLYVVSVVKWAFGSTGMFVSDRVGRYEKANQLPLGVSFLRNMEDHWWG